MSKVPRRKKLVTIDGAQFIISPLTYNQLEEHATKSKEYNDLKKEAGPDAPADRRQLRSIALWVVACGLNNASPDLPVTEGELLAEMDDVLADNLLREIFTFSGVVLPSEEEIRRVQGELQASS